MNIPLPNIKRNYHFPNESVVFEKLNKLSYNTNWKVLKGEFTNADPTSFVFWYTGDMNFSVKPLSTRLTVQLIRVKDGVNLQLRACANKMFFIGIAVAFLGFIIQLFRQTSIFSMLAPIWVIVIFIACDRVAKLRAIAELENVLFHQ